jgi:N-acetylneuraminic acid mutarotase
MILDSVEAYDPLDNEWKTVTSLNHPRSCLGLCALDGYLYAFGGWIGRTVDNRVEKYEPMKNKWTMYATMPSFLFAMGVIAFEGLIYIIGGFDDASNALDTVYSYNPVTQQFTPLSSMRRKRGYFGIALLHNSIYAVGGTNGTASLAAVERYSVIDDSWTEIATMSLPRIAPVVAAVNDVMMVIGGKTSGDEWNLPHTLDHVEIYEPEHNKWRDGIPMPTSRGEAAATVL